MRCNKCELTIPDDSGFCPYCGSKVEAPLVEPEKEEILNVSTPQEKEDDFSLFPEITDDMTPEEAFNAFAKSYAKTTITMMEKNRMEQPNNEDDADFGLVPEKPIYTFAPDSVDGEHKYLEDLRTPLGEKIKWARSHSMSADGVNGLIDVYNTFLPSGKPYKTIYINMYGARTSSKAPKGFITVKDVASSFIKASQSPMSKADSSSKAKKLRPKTKKRKVLWTLLILVTIIALSIAGLFGYAEYNYRQATKFFNAQNYDDARGIYSDLGEYRNSSTMVLKCIYYKACANLNNGLYAYSIELFEQVASYGDSEAKISEAMYRYVKENQTRSDSTTLQYLERLVKEGYKDSQEIFNKLYAWKISIIAINSNEQNTTYSMNAIEVDAPVYIHFKLSGGKPNAETKLTIKVEKPNGSVSEYTSDDFWRNGDESWYGWENGIYGTNTFRPAGTLKCSFYDDAGNLLGVASVSMKSSKHSHNYTAKVTPPTCKQRGYTTYTCQCGDSYKSNYTPVEKHNYKNYRCTVCGLVDKANAAEYLEYWVKQNGSYDSSVPYYYYLDEYPKDELCYSVSYSILYDTVFLDMANLTEGVLGYTVLVLSDYSYRTEFGDRYIKGSISAQSFSSSTVVSYQDHYCYEGEIEIMQELARVSIVDILDWFEWFLEEHNIGITIADLGFTAY